jgi:hypothetical protein
MQKTLRQRFGVDTISPSVRLRREGQHLEIDVFGGADPPVLAQELYLAQIHDDRFEVQVPDDFQARRFDSARSA